MRNGKAQRRWGQAEKHNKSTGTKRTDVHDLSRPQSDTGPVLPEMVHDRNVKKQKKNCASTHYLMLTANCCLLDFDISLFSIFQMVVNI